MEQQQIQIVGDPNLYHITNVSINAGDEEVIFTIFSGAQARQFSASPAHAKRIMLLLQKKIEEFEGKHGQLMTQLPEPPAVNPEQGGTGLGFKPTAEK
ncbi:MAG: hypothetical protein ACYDBV_14320 [Nitrospiria bacterium]